jgi:hypothetical protein
MSRFLLRDWVAGRFGQRLAAIDAGVRREGGFYLFTLRLVPAFPFFLVNLLMGLTAMKTWTYFWVSQIGMLAGTVVSRERRHPTGQARFPGRHPFAGSAWLVCSARHLSLIARKLVELVRMNKVFAHWKKPARFDRNLVVIGGGSAGLVTSYIAAAVKAKVTLVEKHKLGGDCLNTGCVPSKALIRSAKFLSHISRSAEFGVASASATIEFSDVMERVQSVIRTVEPHDSAERYTELGVDVVQGSATIVSPWEVDITRDDGSTQRLTTRSIVIATGARPSCRPFLASKTSAISPPTTSGICANYPGDSSSSVAARLVRK